MPEFRITCIRREHGRIAYVGIDGDLYPIFTIIDRILNTDDEFYTFEDGHRAGVIIKRYYWGDQCLSTIPDGIIEDNLGFLPECQ